MNPSYLTDHALLRYAERVKGVNIDAIRAELIEKHERAIMAAIEMGAKSVVLEGHKWSISASGRITTIVPMDRRSRVATVAKCIKEASQ